MQSQQSPEEYSAIAEKVRSGEYFREARRMYDITIHDPMAERYFYLLIAGLSLVAFLISFSALQGLFPLQVSAPFIVNSNDIIEDLPHIKPLAERSGEAPDAGLKRFLVDNYVVLHEEYDIGKFDYNTVGVKNQSTEEVFNNFQQAVDPRNPESPITLYQRHSKRTISGLSTKLVGDSAAETTFVATVEGPGGTKKTSWQANISFQYSGITLDEKTGKTKPFSFVVTKYRSKRVQDSK